MKAATQGLTNEPAALTNSPEQDMSCKEEQASMSETSWEVAEKDGVEVRIDREECSEGESNEERNGDSGKEEAGAVRMHKKKNKGGKKKTGKPEAASEAADHSDKLKQSGIVAEFDSDTLCGNSIPEQSVSEFTLDSDTTASLPLTNFTPPELQETPYLPGRFPNVEHNLAVSATSDTNTPQESKNAQIEALRRPCASCAAITASTQTRIANLEAEREALKAELDNLDATAGDARQPDPKRDGGTHKPPTKKKPKAGKSKKKAGGIAEDPQVVQLRKQIRALDELIDSSKREQRVGELRCEIRRYDAYIHEESIRWLHIDECVVDVPVRLRDYARTMAVLHADVKPFERAVARLEKGRDCEEDFSAGMVSEWFMDQYVALRTLLDPPSKKVYDWEGPRQTVWERLAEAYAALPTLWVLSSANARAEECPCGQPVSGRLMNLFMLLLMLWVLHSWFG